jgi:hypothetical protein
MRLTALTGSDKCEYTIPQVWVVGTENDLLQGGGGARRRASCSRRRWNSTPIRPRSAQRRCAPPHATHRTRSLARIERYSRVARPASRGRSVRSACARTFTNPPVADGIRLFDPLAGLNQPDSALRGHHGAMGRRSSRCCFCRFVSMSRWRSRRVVAQRGVLAAPSAARRYRCVRVELRTLVCGSRRGLVCLAVRLLG